MGTAAVAKANKQVQTEVSSTEDTPLLDKAIATTTAAIDRRADNYTQELHRAGLGRLERALLMAEAIEHLRHAIDDKVMGYMMRLMNSRLGFKTDKGPHNPKSPTPYSREVVKECLIEALLNGVYPTGNEFNIIAGQCYVTKEGYFRKLRETPGLTDLVLSPGIPTIHNGQTVVRFAASWRYNGQQGQLLGPDGKPGRTIPVPVNSITGVDAVLGKATRKALKAVYEQIHGSEHTLPDGDVEDSTGSALPESTTLPVGRHKLRSGPAAPEEQLDQIKEQAEQEDLQKSDSVNDVGERIQNAESEAELQSIAADIEQMTDWLGENIVTQLGRQLQARRKQLSKEAERG